MGGAVAGGGGRGSCRGLRGEWSGGAPAAPPLPQSRVRARREELRECCVFLHFEEPGWIHDGIELWRARSVQPVEHRRSPGVHGHSGEGRRPEEAREGASAEREEQDQVGRVVEREAELELEIPAGLVEEPG